MAEEATKDTDADGCSHYALLVAALLIWLAWPLSVYCVGALILAGLLEWARSGLEKAEPEKPRLRTRILAGMLGDFVKASSWFAIGTSLLCILLLVVRLFSGAIEAAAVLDFQLGVYDRLDGLSELASPVHAGLVIVLALILSLALNALWPLVAVGRARKAASGAIGILTAVVSFTFVGVQEGAASYEASTAPMRAEIVGNLEALRRARQEGAALAWLRAALDRQARQDPQSLVAWAEYFTKGVEQCRIADESYERGYRSVATWQPPGSYCDVRAYARQLAANLIHTDRVPRGGPAPLAWLAAYSGAERARRGGDSLTSIPPRRLADLRSLPPRARADRQQAEEARDAIRSAVSSQLSELFDSHGLGGLAGAIVDGWKDAVLEVIVKESADMVSRRLRQPGLPAPGVAADLLEIEGENLRFDSAAAEARRRGSLPALLAAVWQRLRGEVPPDGPASEQAGANAARAELAAAAERRRREESERLERLREGERAREIARRGRGR